MGQSLSLWMWPSKSFKIWPLISQPHLYLSLSLSLILWLLLRSVPSETPGPSLNLHLFVPLPEEAPTPFLSIVELIPHNPAQVSLSQESLSPSPPLHLPEQSIAIASKLPGISHTFLFILRTLSVILQFLSFPQLAPWEHNPTFTHLHIPVSSKEPGAQQSLHNVLCLYTALMEVQQCHYGSQQENSNICSSVWTVACHMEHKSSKTETRGIHTIGLSGSVRHQDHGELPVSCPDLGPHNLNTRNCCSILARPVKQWSIFVNHWYKPYELL